MVDHGKSTKRKKFHDKDKYYRLAKEQGLRSRAAFKLSQINRQYPILDKSTKIVLDLCAAPGGWTQIAARECGPNTHIVAVDILPIRRIIVPKNSGGTQQAITTIVGDITTDKCKAEIKRAIAGTNAAAVTKNDKAHTKVDVVLHDGAPNVGASYDRDAYEQMELSVHALRCATQHLKKGGVFCTKIYRSKDSASFQWVVQQLFQEVTMFKPKASRPQSAEIFYICQGYFAPQKIDPKLLDPQHIFELVEGDTTGGAGVMEGSQNFHVFHKNWEKANQKNRQGYDWSQVDANLRKVEPLCNFIHAKGSMGAIQLLSSCTGFSFHSEHDKDTPGRTKAATTTASSSPPCDCRFFLHHPLTTPEIKECLTDLKVLNKGDFKSLMVWRDKMRLALDEVKEDKKDQDGDQSDDDSDNSQSDEEHGDGSDSDDNEEEQIQKEIQSLRERKLREKKKSKKKERKLAGKKRRQAALGMDLNAIEVQEDDQFFSLSILKSSGDLQKVSEVNIDQATDDQVFGVESEDEDGDDIALGKIPAKDEETGYSYRLERDLDAAYERYLENTKNGAAKSGTKAAKRSKKLLREKLAEESHEDHELLLSNPKGMSEDLKAYAAMLQGPKDSDDDGDDSSEDEEEEDDGFHAEPMTPEEQGQRQAKKQKLMPKEKDASNPLIHRFTEEPTSAKTARWFSNPLFASIGEAAELAQAKAQNDNEQQGNVAISDSDVDQKTTKPSPRSRPGSRQKKSSQDDDPAGGLDPEEILAMIPKTDKQKRHEKRLKALERDERRQARKAKKLGEAEGEFSLVPADDEDDDGAEIAKLEGMSDEKKQKLQRARDLIKAGMGVEMSDSGEGNNRGFEVVEADRPLPVVDERRYDSDHEEYDSDDYAKTMALGTMMLRKSKAKALVDASYNRYAWNDPEGLPEWFMDDENRHYRPQLPIPAALLQKMKDKQMSLSVRPIAKVAEARARKNRNAKHKLAAAKKKAQSLAGSSDMSEAMKLKQISKALRSSDAKKSGKEKIVSKKGRKGVKGATMVDKRMKSDARGMKRAEKKKRSRK